MNYSNPIAELLSQQLMPEADHDANGAQPDAELTALLNSGYRGGDWRPDAEPTGELPRSSESLVQQRQPERKPATTMTIMRRIKFCAGHRLYRHESKCAFFHGHNYTADFYVSGSETDAVGRLIDFGELKRAFKGWLDDNWDHAFLLFEDDHNAINAIKQVTPTKYYLLPYNPTAENMARYLLEEVSPKLLAPLGVSAAKVVIWETEQSFAEASVTADGEIQLTNVLDD